MRPSWSPRSWRRSEDHRTADARTATRPTTSPRPSRSPSAPRTCPGGSTSPTTRSCRPGTSPTSTPSSPGLGGPNFDQLPINRPHSPVNTTQRDGFGQQAVAEGIAAYNPNSLGGGCPFPARDAGSCNVPRTVSGPRVRVRAQSFSDHYSQATLFWKSMSPPEQDHIVAAFSFELGKCLDEEVKDRMLANLANVDADLVAQVAANLGTPAPSGKPATNIAVTRALAHSVEPGPIAGRVIGMFAADGVDRGVWPRCAAASNGRRHRGGHRPPWGNRSPAPTDRSR